ncbi:MAG: hypothetical protein QXF23_07085 [Candidatus Bathyarchaeia archaeon]|nr:hypothetical protein [Candidatus Bathyarchaeota archaeon]
MEGVDLSEPIGRKTVKKTLESLKAYVNLKSNLFKAEEKSFLKMLEEIKRDIDETDKSKKDFDFISVVLDYSNSASDLIRALQLYVEALEAYVSELDETFDSLLEDAKKMSEQAVREIPRDKLPFYG